jgi:hypothetical protein
MDYTTRQLHGSGGLLAGLEGTLTMKSVGLLLMECGFPLGEILQTASYLFKILYVNHATHYS